LYETTEHNARVENGTIVRSFKIREDQLGGEYMIKVESIDMRLPKSERKIRIRSYLDRAYFVTVDFDKETYTPGDKVRAKVKVRRADKQEIKSTIQVEYLAKFEQDKEMGNLDLEPED
jgi:predicted metalloprotease